MFVDFFFSLSSSSPCFITYAHSFIVLFGKRNLKRRCVQVSSRIIFLQTRVCTNTSVHKH